jgi:hypothetical protein
MQNKELKSDQWVNAKSKGNKRKSSLNEVEIYKSLRDFGLRFSYVDRVGYYYFRQTGITVTSLLHIKDLVWDKLRSQELVSKELVLNAYLENDPFKKLGLLKNILQDKPTDEEIHLIKLQVDITYKKKFEIELMITTLKNLNFTKAVDNHGDFGKADIYFKRKSDHEFVVLSHYCKGKNILNQGFDCWITTYKRESDIGTRKPLLMDSLRLSFHLDRDVQLIKT